MLNSLRKLFGQGNALEAEIKKRKRIEQRFIAFMSNSPFPAWVKDSQGRHEYFNRTYVDTFGLPMEDWKGKTDFDLWPDEIAARHISEDRKVLETGKPIAFETREPLSNGQFRYWYVVKFPFNFEEGEEFVGGIAVDISRQRKAEAELDRFFEASNDMMCIGNSDLRVTRVNKACHEILGYTPEEFCSLSLVDLVHPRDLRKTEAARRANEIDGHAVQFENRIRHKDGSYRIIAWNTPVPNPNSVVIYAVGRDVTEQRTLEERLLQVADDEQNRIANDLHDGLGQELAGVSMMAQSLANSLQTRSLPEARLAEKIAVQLEASLQLTRSLARGLRPVEIDSRGLGSALSNLADQTSDRFRIECTFDSNAEIKIKDSNLATQLYRIAQEAVTNAAKHATPSRICIILNQSDSSLELQVRDDGIGFSKEQESGGDGIGLKSMKYRSDLIGGTLTIESEESCGTSVSCRLPFFTSTKRRGGDND